MSVFTLEHCERVAADHRKRAVACRTSAKAYLPADPEYDQLMRMVGFHHIQASLWDKQAEQLKENA